MSFETDAIRFGYERSNFNEHTEAIFTTSSFVFDSAEEAMQSFAGETENNIYSRFTNPTIDAFARKLARLEHGDSAVVTTTGMAANFAAIMALLQRGDHLVASRSMFGTTVVLLNNFIVRYGIEITWVNLSDVSQWQDAVQSNTKMFLLETPSNPLAELVDIKALSDIAHQHDIWLAVDNCMLTPYLQTPLDLGADIVIHSATKYIDGQGRMLMGAVVAKSEVMEPIASFMRSTGLVASPFNAWIGLKGLETLAIRMDAHCHNAELFAQHFDNLGVPVQYLGLSSHPFHALATTQQRGYGGVLTIDLGSRERAFAVINATKLFSITANFGDAKSTITHPATTTHGRLSPEEQVASGITQGMIRLSIGLEHVDDIIGDIHL